MKLLLYSILIIVSFSACSKDAKETAIAYCEAAKIYDYKALETVVSDDLVKSFDQTKMIMKQRQDAIDAIANVQKRAYAQELLNNQLLELRNIDCSKITVQEGSKGYKFATIEHSPFQIIRLKQIDDTWKVVR